MIKVRKTEEPQALSHFGYACDEVREVLIRDMDEKCYICERSRDTDLEIEHLQSRKKHPALENVWQNLFISCGYCNKKKGSYHDGMLHPDLCEVESIIDHRVDLMSEKAVFSSDDKSDEVKSAVRLLSKVFNGARRNNKPRRIIEQLFWDRFKKEYIDFLSVVDRFLAGDKESENDVRELLDIREEYLAFKYFIIKNNPILFHTFQKDIIWNK